MPGVSWCGIKISTQTQKSQEQVIFGAGLATKYVINKWVCSCIYIYIWEGALISGCGSVPTRPNLSQLTSLMFSCKKQNLTINKNIWKISGFSGRQQGKKKRWDIRFHVSPFSIGGVKIKVPRVMTVCYFHCKASIYLKNLKLIKTLVNTSNYSQKEIRSVWNPDFKI